MAGTVSESCKMKCFGITCVETSDSTTTALVSYFSCEVNELEHILDVYFHILTYIDIIKTLTIVTATPQNLLNPTQFRGCIILQISIRFHNMINKVITLKSNYVIEVVFKRLFFYPSLYGKLFWRGDCCAITVELHFHFAYNLRITHLTMSAI